MISEQIFKLLINIRSSDDKRDNAGGGAAAVVSAYTDFRNVIFSKMFVFT